MRPHMEPQVAKKIRENRFKKIILKFPTKDAISVKKSLVKNLTVSQAYFEGLL